MVILIIEEIHNLAAIVALLLYLFVDPFERGFFCNDESLIHPYREDTISTLALALVGGFVGITLVSFNLFIEHVLNY